MRNFPLSSYVLPYITLLFLIISCGGNTPKQPKNHQQPTAQKSIDITREIPLSQEFQHITNLSSLNIVFTPGDYHVKATGDSLIVSNLNVAIDGGVLTLSLPMENNTDFNRFPQTNNAVIYVSCPTLRNIANCGNGGFQSSGKIISDHINIGGMGTGDISLDSVECTTFRYELSQSNTAQFKQINAKDASILCHGTGDTQANITATHLVTIDESHMANISSKVSAPEIDVITIGSGAVNLHVSAKKLSVSAQGTGNVTLNGHCDDLQLKQGTNARVSNNLH